MKIPFNKIYLTGHEFAYMKEACEKRSVAGDGIFTQQCNEWLQQHIGCGKAMLTNSCTAALEMTALLLHLKPGDEIIMPSFTFVSSANAFVLHGAVPVFVDIREDTLTIDVARVKQAITQKTRAIVVVHYAGVGADMDALMSIARDHGLILIEDAAHGIMAEYKGRRLGSMGHLACLSFHETKNLTCGEGGALLINDERFRDEAEIIAKKGTDRNKFLRGEVDKYSWVAKGSSFLPSDITAAFLWAQLERAVWITQRRREIWQRYHQAFAALEDEGLLKRPVVPQECSHNGHLYYLLLNDQKARDSYIAFMKEEGIHCVFHYVPLHQSVAGQRYARSSGNLNITEQVARRLVRLPLWVEAQEHLGVIISKATAALKVPILCNADGQIAVHKLN